MTTTAHARLALGAAAVLSVNEAARLLPMKNGTAVEWLERRGLVHQLEGRRVVVWGDVVATIRQQPEERAEVAPLPRVADY